MFRLQIQLGTGGGCLRRIGSSAGCQPPSPIATIRSRSTPLVLLALQSSGLGRDAQRHCKLRPRLTGAGRGVSLIPTPRQSRLRRSPESGAVGIARSWGRETLRRASLVPLGIASCDEEWWRTTEQLPIIRSADGLVLSVRRLGGQDRVIGRTAAFFGVAGADYAAHPGRCMPSHHARSAQGPAESHLALSHWRHSRTTARSCTRQGPRELATAIHVRSQSLSFATSVV